MADGRYAFEVCARFERGTIYCDNKRDADPLLRLTRTWVRALRTGKSPFSYEDMLAPVAVLEAIEKSLASGKRVRVAKPLL